ncbi:sulfatase [Membranihabitans marinus]|uniref:sulfatase n=1 Tax=Membranihabitans marinus TaxID=1227546 RepID=UPI001F3EACA5|nr:sulfatase [Membranihabitans marinus]
MISKYYLLRAKLSVVISSVVLLLSSFQLLAQTDKPNIVFIAVDDLNDWIGPLRGHPNVSTPNIDRLAAKSILFSNAHCQAPLCGPSRASIMTGLRPSTTGIYGMVGDDEIVIDNSPTSDIVFLPEYFKNNGYHTMGIGKLFHSHAPKNMFDESGGRAKGFGPKPENRFVWEGDAGPSYGRTSTDWGAFPESDHLMPDYKSTQWAIERLGKDYDQPFFLAVGFLRPHVPWYVPEKWLNSFDPDLLTLPPYKLDDLDDVPPIALEINDLPMMPTTKWAVESGEYKNIVQAYLACVKFVDDQVGQILDAIESSRYSDNTIIVLWSDHGYRLGEKGSFAKHCLWEEATKVPLIIYSPKHQSRVVDDAVELLSLYPTLVDLAELPKNESNEGLSLIPLMDGRSLDGHRYAITTFGKNNHAVRSKDFRYIVYEDGSEELYDHRIDPNEWVNEIENENYKYVLEELRQQIPTVNANWHKNSSYDFQPYFKDQKKRFPSN